MTGATRKGENLPCSVPGPVMGPGESGEWKVSNGLTRCPVAREVCMALESDGRELPGPPGMPLPSGRASALSWVLSTGTRAEEAHCQTEV